MNILICDDQASEVKKIAQRLAEYAKRTDLSAEIYSCCAPQKMAALPFEKYDIVFLDIDMGTVSGIELAKIIRMRRQDSVIVFITNFIEYAPDGYEVKAFRYLLKANMEQKLFGIFCEAAQEYQKRRHIISFLIEGEYIDVALKNILYFESEQRMIKIHVLNERCSLYKFYGNMGDITEQLAPVGFLRIQKSYLVNMEHIDALQYSTVRLKGDITLTVSKKNYAQIKHDYMAWRAENRWDI